VLPWQWFVLQLQGFDHRSEIFCFLFVFSLFVIGLCVFVISLGYFVFAEARCNWYLQNINICSLSKKRLPSRQRGWVWVAENTIDLAIFSDKPEIVRKRPTFAKGKQLASHATSGTLWCQKISGKLSPCSPRVAKEARWR
jgi:hypothetical protein